MVGGPLLDVAHLVGQPNATAYHLARSVSHSEEAGRQHHLWRHSSGLALGKFGSVLKHTQTLDGLVLGIIQLPSPVCPVRGTRFDPVFVPVRNDPVFRLHGGL
jgi:hypothetical protein